MHAFHSTAATRVKIVIITTTITAATTITGTATFPIHITHNHNNGQGVSWGHSCGGKTCTGCQLHRSDVDQVCDCLVNVSSRLKVRKKYRIIDNLYFERNVLMCFLFAWCELMRCHPFLAPWLYCSQGLQTCV